MALNESHANAEDLLLCTVMHSSASERKVLIASQCRPDKDTERLLHHVLPLAQRASLKYGPVVGSLRVALLLKAGKHQLDHLLN